MKKKIAILGSTGSIGKTLLKIINNDKKKFEIKLLAARKNYIYLLKQATKFKVKNLIITNYDSYIKLKSKTKNTDIKVFNNFDELSTIFNKKIDYVMSSITGFDGLIPTLKIIKFTKKIAIANKEAIICGWRLIEKELKYYKTNFIPVDSEHFSLWYGLKNNHDKIHRIYLTASGGPFTNLPLSRFKKISIKQALNHPNWKMGKKITIDSATMMNKVFEIIEAKNIFNLSYDQLMILIHPKSYVHSIIKFQNGLIKLIAHDTSMEIPVFNSIYTGSQKKIIKSRKLDLTKLNKLDLKKINVNKFPLTKLLNKIPSKSSLFETVLVSANDEFVKLFLKKKIKFIDISKNLIKFMKKKEFQKYKIIAPKKVHEIVELNKYVRLKINPKSI